METVVDEYILRTTPSSCSNMTQTEYIAVFNKVSLDALWESDIKSPVSELKPYVSSKEDLKVLVQTAKKLGTRNLTKYEFFSQLCSLEPSGASLRLPLFYARAASGDLRMNKILGLSHAKHRLAAEKGVEHPTIATLKFVEILEHYGILRKLIAKDTTAFHASFTAELPGAFVAALFHIMSARYPDVKYTWQASSLLCEGGNTALDDSYGYYARYKDNWLMHDCNNGDVTVAENLLDFEAQTTTLADFSCHDLGLQLGDFLKEEEDNIVPNAGATYACLASLRNGGMFVGKHFTFYTTESVEKLRTYTSLFREFYVCKPYASKAANSEVYLVGLDFDRSAFLDIKQSLLDSIRAANPCLTLAPTLLQEMFSKRQIKSINTAKNWTPRYYCDPWSDYNSMPAARDFL